MHDCKLLEKYAAPVERKITTRQSRENISTLILTIIYNELLELDLGNLLGR
jgi:hypothetical protein